MYKKQMLSNFSFQTKVWNRLNLETVRLQQVFRQSDPVFAKCLARIRVGTPSAEDIRMLTSRLHATIQHDKIKPTFLHSRLDEVTRMNQEHLDEINEPPHCYSLLEGFMAPKQDVDNAPPKTKIDRVIVELRRNVPADHELTLKVGAQVILLVNLSFQHQLINGSRGVVMEFKETSPGSGIKYPVVRFDKVTTTVHSHMWKHVFKRCICLRGSDSIEIGVCVYNSQESISEFRFCSDSSRSFDF